MILLLLKVLLFSISLNSFCSFFQTFYNNILRISFWKAPQPLHLRWENSYHVRIFWKTKRNHYVPDLNSRDGGISVCTSDRIGLYIFVMHNNAEYVKKGGPMSVYQYGLSVCQKAVICTFIGLSSFLKTQTVDSFLVSGS